MVRNYSTHHSYWSTHPSSILDRSSPTYPQLDRDLHTEVVIIGAGITGLSIALELLGRGMRVAIFEALTIGAGTTGGSSGHLDAHPEAGPIALRNKLGLEKAKKYVEFRLRAIDEIERRCGRESLIRRIPGYYYSEKDADRDQLQAECATALELGLETQWQDSLPLAHAKCGYRIEGMGRLDCLAYLYRLARLVSEAGGQIFEKTKVEGPAEKHPTSLKAGSWNVRFDHAVCATHSNFTDALRIDLQVPAYQSYVLAAKVSDPPPDALYWDNANPYFYTRLVSDADEPLVLIGGCDHRTGAGDPLTALLDLDTYARQRFAVREIVSTWSAEFFQPVDGLPLIGKVPNKDNVWIATGLNGVGLTWGTASGWMIADEIAGGEMPLGKELSPSRIPYSGLGTLATEQIPGAVNLSKRVLPAKDVEPHLQTGEGRVGMVDGVHTAICRDRHGCEHRLNPVCTHMGGVVRWNPTEGTWDCPVHGGRFAADGHRLYGPPPKDLPQQQETMPVEGAPHD